MRLRSDRTLGALVGATVLTLGGAGTAYACWPDASGAPAAGRVIVASTVSNVERPLALTEFRSDLVDAKLARLTLLVGQVQAKLPALPAGTALTPKQRLLAKGALDGMGVAQRKLAWLETTDDLVLTAAQQAKVDSLQASLASIAGRLRALLAKPAVAAQPRAAVTRRALAKPDRAPVLGARFDRDGRCDGRHDGIRSGDRDRSWDGDPRWDGDGYRDRRWDGTRH
jgi:hypothetical protein